MRFDYDSIMIIIIITIIQLLYDAVYAYIIIIIIIILMRICIHIQRRRGASELACPVERGATKSKNDSRTEDDKR